LGHEHLFLEAQELNAAQEAIANIAKNNLSFISFVLVSNNTKLTLYVDAIAILSVNFSQLEVFVYGKILLLYCFMIKFVL
jgi:hypothetical protein